MKYEYINDINKIGIDQGRVADPVGDNPVPDPTFKKKSVSGFNPRKTIRIQI